MCFKPAGNGDASQPACERRPPLSDVFLDVHDSRLPLVLLLCLSARLWCQHGSQRPALHNAAAHRLGNNIFHVWGSRDFFCFEYHRLFGEAEESWKGHLPPCSPLSRSPTLNNRNPAGYCCSPQHLLSSPDRPGKFPSPAQSPSSFCSSPWLRDDGLVFFFSSSLGIFSAEIINRVSW